MNGRLATQGSHRESTSGLQRVAAVCAFTVRTQRWPAWWRVWCRPPAYGLPLCQPARQSHEGAGAALGPRFLDSAPLSSPAAYWRRHVASADEYTPSRRISAPISPGLVHAAATSTMRRLSALVLLRRFARGTTSETILAGNSRVDTGASSVALRAPCDAPVSTESLAACIRALG